jgi:hypothetical protein
MILSSRVDQSVSDDGSRLFVSLGWDDLSWGCNHGQYYASVSVSGPNSGSWNGWGAGGTVDLPFVEGTYDVTGQLSFYCDCVNGPLFEFASSQVVVQQQPPTISGPNELWSFGGETVAGYTTSITLTSTGGIQTQWSITAGADKVYLSATAGGSTTVTSSGMNVSRPPGNDIRIRARVGQLWSEHTLTTRGPDHTVLQGPPLRQCLASGYDVWYTYDVFDQFGQLMPYPIPVNESWIGSWVPDQNRNWPRADPNGAWWNSSFFQDHISIDDGNPPVLNPTPICSHTNTDKVDHWGQEWRVGSTDPGRGRPIQRNTLQRFLGTASHLDVVTPALP